MRVSALYASNPLRGQDVYVVGLGASMTVFPSEHLRGRLCVLLNDAQKFFPDLGPVALANHRAFLHPLSPSITFPVVKGRLKSAPNPDVHDNHVRWDDATRYVFSYRTAPPDSYDTMDDATLFREPDFYWRGPVAVYAVQFLLHCGARSITMVGCDCGPLAGLDYCDDRAEIFRRELAKTPERKRGFIALRHNYKDYSYGLVRLRREARARGVPIMSLTPFFGLDEAEAQFRQMREQDGHPIRQPVVDNSMRAARRRAVMEARAKRKEQAKNHGKKLARPLRAGTPIR